MSPSLAQQSIIDRVEIAKDETFSSPRIDWGHNSQRIGVAIQSDTNFDICDITSKLSSRGVINLGIGF